MPSVWADLWERARTARRVGIVSRKRQTSLAGSQTAEAAAAFLNGQEITTTQCAGCGKEINGIKGRYSCSCGWTNPWWEGHGNLPLAQDDPDWPGHEDDVQE